MGKQKVTSNSILVEDVPMAEPLRDRSQLAKHRQYHMPMGKARNAESPFALGEPSRYQ